MVTSYLRAQASTYRPDLHMSKASVANRAPWDMLEAVQTNFILVSRPTPFRKIARCRCRSRCRSRRRRIPRTPLTAFHDFEGCWRKHEVCGRGGRFQDYSLLCAALSGLARVLLVDWSNKTAVDWSNMRGVCHSARRVKCGMFSIVILLRVPKRQPL